MVYFEEAVNTVLANAAFLGTEKVRLEDALGRVLAEDTHYDIALPPIDRSAMDGYACRKEDLGRELLIVEEIFAGFAPTRKIEAGQCAKIMTGAVVPDGADCVVMKEHAIESKGRVRFTVGKSNTNIRYAGEDIQVGDLALPQGSLLTAKHIPVLAGAGIVEPVVARRPRVAVFATGTELVEPHQKPESFQLRNSNAPQMLAQLAEMRIRGNYGGIIPDDYEATRQRVDAALKEHDIVVLSGGVSEGERDFIPAVIKELGFDILLTRIAVQPGKPIIFARRGKQYCFGLAGNPASSFVQFELYLKPFLYKLMGFDFKPRMAQATLLDDYSRRKSERLLFVPARLNDDLTLTKLDYHGSAHINAMVNANCLLMMPVGVSELKKGERANVRCL